MNYTWIPVNTTDFEHRFFRTPEGRIAVADGSGEHPEDTDDGVLWLDMDRPINEACELPLVDTKGNHFRTPCSVKVAAYVAVTFGLRFIDPEGQVTSSEGYTREQVEHLYRAE